MRPFLRVVAVAGLTALAVPAAAPASSGRCDWGGNPLGRTGTFTIAAPGLHNTPAASDVPFEATGSLTGDDPRCEGTLTIVGVFKAGSNCAVLADEGIPTFRDAEGEPIDHGISRFEGVGGAYGRINFFDADGGLVATMDPFARSNDAVPFTESCASERGLREGVVSTVRGLDFLE